MSGFDKEFLSSLDLEVVFNLLSEYDLKIVDRISERLSCCFCKRILNNTHQTICGCKYCKACIDKKMSAPDRQCVNKEHAKWDVSETIVPDHELNQVISKLIAKCVNEGCEEEYQLIYLSRHLEKCPKRIVVCPFNKYGCQTDKICDDAIDEHFQRDSRNHMRILSDRLTTLESRVRESDADKTVDDTKAQIQLIRNEYRNNLDKLNVIVNEMRNELNNVKENEKKYKEEIEKLEEKENIIENLKERLSMRDEEIEAIKAEKEKTDRIIENMQQKINELLAAVERKCDNERIEAIKTEIDREILNKYSGEINERQSQYERKVEGMERHLMVMDRAFVWYIGKIDGIKLEQEIFSEYFYKKHYLYKFGLSLYNSPNSLQIDLLVYSSADDDNLDWPFKAQVTIKIYHKLFSNKYKSVVTKECILKQPTGGYQQSEWFMFNKCDFAKSEQSNNEVGFVIECLIKL